MSNDVDLVSGKESDPALRDSRAPSNEERVPTKKVMVGLPMYGGVEPLFMLSMIQLVRQLPCEMVLKPCLGDSLVSRARNRIAAAFLASDCTHLLFLDSDLIFSPEHIARLVAHDLPIVAGLYPKKQKELGWVCNMLDTPKEPEGDLQEVKYAGTGCLMIAREVFEEILRFQWAEEYDPDDGDEPGVKWDFFAVGVVELDGRRRYLSEDWFFCERARICGYRIMMDTRVVLKHVGQMIYPLQDLAEFGELIDKAA